MMEPGLNHVLFISTALFFIGVFGFLTRRNLITMLMSIELVLNSVNINFIAFNKYLWPNKLDGLFFSIFVTETAQIIVWLSYFEKFNFIISLYILIKCKKVISINI